MKRRNIIALAQVVANEQTQILNKLDLSAVEGAGLLLVSHEKLQKVLTDGPNLSRKKMIKALGAVDWADHVPPQTTNPNRIVQHLYENATMAVKDALNPDGMVPLQFTPFERLQFEMLLGIKLGDAVLSMDPTAEQSDGSIVPLSVRTSDGTVVSESDQQDAAEYLADREQKGLKVHIKVIGEEKNGKSALAIEIHNHLESLGIAAKLDDCGEDCDETYMARQPARLEAIKERGIVVTIETIKVE